MEVGYEEAKELAVTAIRAGLTPIIWGPPGIGKSTLAREIRQRMGLEGMFDLRPYEYEAVELRGIPQVSPGQDSFRWVPPDILPKEGTGLFLVDDATAETPPDMFAALMRLTLERRIGEWELPPGWHLMLVANYGLEEMLEPLTARLFHIRMKLDIEELIRWAMKQEFMPPEIIGFWRLRPELVFAPEAKDPNTGAFPTGRTWEFVGRALSNAFACDPDAARDYRLIQMITESGVGETTAAEFVAAYRLLQEAPTFDEIVADPHGVEVPKSIGAIYLIAALVARKMDEKTAKPALEYLSRASKDVAWLAAKNAVEMNEYLGSVTAIRDILTEEWK